MRGVKSEGSDIGLGGLTLVLAIAVFGALFLALLPVSQYADRVNYLSYASHSPVIWENLGGGLKLFFNEPLWLGVNIILSYFLSPSAIVRVFVFIPAFLIIYLSLKYNKKSMLWVMAFILFPDVIRLNIVWLRQGAAFAIFLLGWYSSNKTLKYFCYALTPFIHSSFFIILPILFVARTCERIKVDRLLLVALFTIACLLLGLSIIPVAHYLELRQGAEYAHQVIHVSGEGLLFWLVFLLVMLSEGRQFVKENTFQLFGLIFYMTTYYTFQYSYRVFSSFLLLLFISGLELTGIRKVLFIVLFLLIFSWSWHVNTFV